MEQRLQGALIQDLHPKLGWNFRKINLHCDYLSEPIIQHRDGNIRAENRMDQRNIIMSTGRKFKVRVNGIWFQKFPHISNLRFIFIQLDKTQNLSDFSMLRNREKVSF